MKWSKEATEAVAKAPFFVRKKVKKRVEEEAARLGANEVLMEHVQSCRKKFVDNMESEVKGYQVETCFGPGGCPNRAVKDLNMAQTLESLLAEKNLKAFLKERVKGPLKMHHEFRVTLADCPNACSRPQIVDVGLIGACRPRLTPAECSGCGACAEICREGAISIDDTSGKASIDLEKCLFCGQCATICPVEAIKEDARGYRILVGGKLGRHPRLGVDLGRIFSYEEAVAAVRKHLDHYMEHNREGERFGEILIHHPLDDLG